MKISFEHFARLCQGQQLEAVRVNGTHWQIKGGLRIVNVYPFSRKGASYYIQGMSKGVKGSPAKAIQAAKKPPRQEKRHDRNKSKINRRVRDRLWRSQQGNCKWCGEPVPKEEATLDHIVALSRGGGNGTDNLCMACKDCNNRRGNNCTAEELLKGGES